MKKSNSLESHLGYWLRYVSNQVSGTFSKTLSSYNISVAEWVVLNLLSEHKLFPAAIAKSIGMTRGAASKILDKLYKKQLIHRTNSIQDRRYSTICLSQTGENLLPKLRQVADQNDHHFFGHLSEKEKSQLLHTLESIVSANPWDQIPIN